MFTLGAAAALATSVTWVIGSSAYTHLSRRYSPAAINFNRALLGLVIFVGLSLTDVAGIAAQITALGPAFGGRVGWLVASILASYVLGDGLFLWAALSLGFPAAQAVCAIYPLWATLGAVLFFGEPLSALRAAGILLSIVGVVIVVLSGKGEQLAPPAHLGFLRSRKNGLLIALGVSVLWGVNAFAVGRGGDGLNPAFANIIRMLLALALCPIMVRFQSPDHRLRLERADYRRFGALIALEAGVGSTLYVYGLSHTPVAVGSTLSSLAPIISVPIAVVLGWERFSLKKLIAICIVVCGLVLLVQ